METARPKYDYAAFGARLKEARENAGLTQAQACEAVGIPKAQVLSSYERGVSNPPIDTLAALAQIYGASLDELIFADEKPKKKKSTGDWLFLLISVIDQLMIMPVPIDDKNTPNRNYYSYDPSGTLCWGENSIYNDFFSKWYKLREAWLDKLIDTADYYHLVRRHANQVPDDPELANYQARADELLQKMKADGAHPQKNGLARFLDFINPYSDLYED